MRTRRHWRVAMVLVVTIVLAACASSTKNGASSSTTAAGAFRPSTTLGTGVTATTIKVGIALVDFSCIKQFVTALRETQDKIYGDFINDVNQHGGIDGRKIVPVYHSFCPIGSTAAVSLCTKFAEDDKVFAVLGNFIDFSGDAQTCLAKQHNVVLMTFQLTQAIMNQSPPGLIVEPGVNPERVDSVLVNLMKKEHTLDGKTVAVLGETTSSSVVKNSVEPQLKKLGVKTGTTAILSISGSDTTSAQSQLDSFVERWKTEHVDAIFISGTQVASQQFVEKLRADMPGVTLVSDITDVLTYGQEEKKAGRNPNPYEGIISADGPTAQEYDLSANWKYCAAIYLEQTGKVAPNGEMVIPLPNGKTLDTYGTINDSCQLVTMFHDIAARVGKYLNVGNWVHTVNTYGPIRNMGGGAYASLSTGKYDVSDTFRLEEFDSSLGAKGNWKPITPLEDISGS